MKYLKTGDTYKVVKEKDISIKNSLPAKRYVVTKDPDGSMYLKSLPKEKLGIVLPAYFYDCWDFARTVVDEFNCGKENVCAIISGDKQNGKTLLSRLISKLAIVFGNISGSVRKPLFFEYWDEG